MIHTGPGRRFAKGTTKGDHLLGLFGFISHMFLFIGIGVAIGHFVNDQWALGTMILNLGAAAVCLIIRAMQVGSTTTKESIQAIKDAWS